MKLIYIIVISWLISASSMPYQGPHTNKIATINITNDKFVCQTNLEDWNIKHVKQIKPEINLVSL